MKERVFLDSGIFIAFLNRRDGWHEQAVSLFGGPKPTWFTSYLVISETYSWFLHRMGEEAARQFRFFLENLPDLKIMDASSNDHQETFENLDRFRGNKLSYVDAASLHYLNLKKITQVWSTDFHLALTGIEVLPRS